MQNHKRARNLWLFSGAAFFMAAISQLNSSVVYMPYLSGITSLLAFINAYINHKKFRKEES